MTTLLPTGVKGETFISRSNQDTSQVKSILGPCALIFCSAFTGTWRVVRPAIEMTKSIQCGICEKHCPTDVMATGKKYADPAKGLIAHGVSFCAGCGLELAIRIILDVLGEKTMIVIPQTYPHSSKVHDERYSV